MIDYLGLTSIVGVFLLLSFVVHARSRRNRMLHDERMELIKSGREIPVEWERARPSKSRAFFWGVILTGFGAGLQILQGFDFVADLFRGRLYRYHGSGDYFAGVIFAALGLALIWYHNYQHRQDSKKIVTTPVEPQKREETNVQQ